MLDFLHGKVVNFEGSVLGFGELDQFSVTVVEEKGPYAYLQSVEDDSVGFLVAVPFFFYPDYQFAIEDKDKAALQIKTHEEVAVLGIITIHEPFAKSTMNLLAPLIINSTNLLGRQIVLPPEYKYGTKEPLFRKIESGSEGSEC